jgi:competence protein ComEC
MTAAPPAGHLRITVLDVGQGDGVLVQFPDGHSMLVDSGGAGPQFDIGRRVVVPASWALGVRRLDWLVITHADGDHIGGAIGVLADLHPREVWEGIPVESDPARTALLADARARGLVWRQVQAGHRIEVGGVTIEAQHPVAPDWERPRVRNDDSLVLRLAYGQVEVLLTGDAAAEFEDRFAPRDARPLRVLKVAHHGSRSSTSPRFVSAFRPNIGLVSAGRGNLFGHPAPDVVARLETAHAEMFRTDLDGAVTLETDGRSILVQTISGRRRLMKVLR